MRSSNPLTMNSPFDVDMATEGAEIGLLSFSPPLDTFVMAVDNPARRAQQSAYRSNIASSPNSDYLQKRRFGDTTGGRRPRRGSVSSMFEDGKM